MYMKKYKNYIIDMCTILGCNAFIYFISQYIIKNYHLIGSALDQKIPFVIEFILVYSIWYPLVIFTMFLLYKYSIDKYNKTKRIVIASLIIAYICFFVYPTTVVRPEVNSFNDLFSLIAYISFKADNPVNCFPSCHCLLSFIMIYALYKENNIHKYLRITLIILFFMIIVSTLLVKQHVIADVIGAFIISILTTFIYPKIKEHLS